ncbi:hypothetical protein BGX27_006823 [Mortierella sp. AM989]|nr:hypothetical protein BGX27_006823 [Mortierella sp. AM989]
MGKRKEGTTDSSSSKSTKRNKSNEIPKTIEAKKAKRNKAQEQPTLKVASPAPSKSASDPAEVVATKDTLERGDASIPSLDTDPQNKSLKNGKDVGSHEPDQVQSQDAISKKKISASLAVTTATVATNLMVPRAVISSGLVPRQVARAKPPATKMPITRPSIGSTASIVSAPGSARTIFRAKDINTASITLSDDTDPDSLAPLPFRPGNNTTRARFRTFARGIHLDSHHPTSSSTASTSYYEDGDSNWKRDTRESSTEEQKASIEGSWGRSSSGTSARNAFESNSSASSPVTGVIKTTTGNVNTIIQAERIIAHPANRKGQFAYPYGNYPNYYEKRTQEQTKGNNLRSKSESGPVTITKPQKSSESQDSPNYKRTDRWKTTPSVLFPVCTTAEEEQPSLLELAKKVDLRFEFLEPSWFHGKKVLDLGCNAALLTVFIALHYKPSKIQGVDIDPSLIGKAQNFVLKTFSQISPHAYTQTSTENNSNKDRKERTKVKSKGEKEKDVKYEAYFPKALHRIHGFLPIPETTVKTEKLFPHNIEFRITDWVTEQGNQEANDSQWDVILGFSLTKWIHLHHGDSGIKQFFQKVYRSLAPGGIFLLEPQAFDTYNRRSKITPEMHATYKSITFRPEEFREYLLSQDVGFTECVHLGHSEGQAKNFNRDIFLYRK